MNRLKIFALIGVLVGLNAIVWSQQVQKATQGIFLLKSGTIYTIINGVIQGDVLIKDGVIAQVGSNISLPSDAIEIDCKGKNLYPGFIDSGTKLGLNEIDAVSVTNDYRENGSFNPHMKALTAVNPNAVAIPVTRVNGVTTVFTKPEGSLFPGTGALIDLFGYSPEYMSAGAEGVILRFPSGGKRGRWDRRSEEDIKKDTEKAQISINEAIEKAQQYAKMDSTAQSQNQDWLRNNAPLDAMLPIVRGANPIFIEVNKKEDILAAIKWGNEYNLKMVLMGVSEGWRVVDTLVKYKIPVITGPVLAMPGRKHDRYDVAYKNAGMMSNAGIKVALRTDDGDNVRNLPFNAGFAVAYGMSMEDALKSVTINAAEIFGVADKYGSIEVGKIANLFVSDGDPFETKTKIIKLFIKGWDIPLESRQTLLYDEFLDRSPR